MHRHPAAHIFLPAKAFYLCFAGQLLFPFFLVSGQAHHANELQALQPSLSTIPPSNPLQFLGGILEGS